MFRKLAFAVVISLGSAGSSPATAQIASTIYNSVINERLRAQYENCLAGLSPTAAGTAEVQADTQRVMDSYFALSSASKKADLKGVFGFEFDGLQWKGPDGIVPIPDLKGRLDSPLPNLTQIAFINSGADGTARGVWRAQYADGSRPAEYYAVDFKFHTGGLFKPNGWRIWHLTLTTGDQPPKAPQPYCYYDKSMAW